MGPFWGQEDSAGFDSSCFDVIGLTPQNGEFSFLFPEATRKGYLQKRHRDSYQWVKDTLPLRLEFWVSTGCFA